MQQQEWTSHKGSGSFAEVRQKRYEKCQKIDEGELQEMASLKASVQVIFVFQLINLVQVLVAGWR